MATTTFTPSMLRGAGTRGIPEIPAGSSFTNDFSMNFDGVDDFIELSSAITLSGVFTVSAWIRPVSISGNDCLILSSATANTDKIGTNGPTNLQIKLGGSTSFISEGGGNDFVTNVWQHLLIIRNSSNVITAFRNGSSFGSPITNTNTGNYNSMGKFKNVTFLDSKLDQVSTFNSDQSSNVSTIYNSGVPGDLTSLSPSHWYQFNEGSGTTAIDSAGGNNGTISGATYSTDVPT
jgi:hypothetical protein